MNLVTYFRRLWAEKTDVTTCMLQNLQHLCATLPQGEAEVWLQSGQVNISLHWNPDEKPQEATLGKHGEKILCTLLIKVISQTTNLSTNTQNRID